MHETRATEGCERKISGFFSNNLVILHQGKLAPYYSIYARNGVRNKKM